MMLAAESRLSFLLKDSRCLRCQLQASRRPLIGLRYASNKSAAASEQPPSKNTEPEIVAPLLLDRPLGLSYPPLPAQNPGIDTRSLRERRDDYVDREKHLARRKEL
jgi:ATPase complex subunit ATP10